MHFEVWFSDCGNIAALHHRIFVLAPVLHTLNSDYPNPRRLENSSYETHTTFNPFSNLSSPLLERTNSHEQSRLLYSLS
jgi:hypothetical protein